METLAVVLVKVGPKLLINCETQKGGRLGDFVIGIWVLIGWVVTGTCGLVGLGETKFKVVFKVVVRNPPNGFEIGVEKLSDEVSNVDLNPSVLDPKESFFWNGLRIVILSTCGGTCLCGIS